MLTLLYFLMPLGLLGGRDDGHPVSLLAETLRALARPRRAIPIAVVGVPLLVAQIAFSGWTPGAAALGVVLLAVFLVTGPWSWRVAFPPDLRAGPVVTALRLAAFVGFALAACAALAVVPEALGVGESFLTAGINLGVTATLYLAGAWSLGTDIELELGLEQARAHAQELALQAERATLLALRAHLDPHFLFNTLNAIAEWCHDDAEVAERAILRLSALLREVMEGVTAPWWELSRELEIATAVWDLYAVRDPDRYRHRVQAPDPVPDLRVPPLILLPLVENAVKHGPAAGHAGELTLTIEVVGPELVVVVGNPGPYAGPRDGGHGLDTVHRRLALSWGHVAHLEVDQVDGRTRATVRMPAEPL